MWPFRKQVSLKDSDIFRGFTDWHCHLLPGVDDGVQTMQESLQVLSLYEELGISEVWLTPHIMEDIPNRTEDLKERFMELNAAYQGNIILHLAAENMLDNLFEERLAKNDLLPLGNEGKHLLVETSYFNPPGTSGTICVYGCWRLPAIEGDERDVPTQFVQHCWRLWNGSQKESRMAVEERLL